MKKPIAIELAKKQKEISVAEFFEKNRHLLGFDNKKKALLTTVKEAVDNALDACEEAGILPEVTVEVIDMEPNNSKKHISGGRYRVIVEDNGPGILKEQVPNIFARLLYGSKFHTLRQSLTGDEPIIVKQDGKIKIVKIGDLIDKYLDTEGVFECKNLNLEVPCFDWKQYKYSFRQVSHLIKHKRRNEIYKITTLYGKNIKVTGCHSVFTIDKTTLKVKEIQARELKKNDILLAPKKLNINENIKEINILDYIDEDYAKRRYWYLYTDKRIIEGIFSRAEIIHKKKRNKSRKYFRFINKNKIVDILEESYKQYIKKGILPVWFVKFLNEKITEGVIRTYYHGKEYDVPIIWPLTRNFMKLIGLFIAEGHSDRRQICFTFSKHERDLVRLVCDVGFTLGASYTVEERSHSVRVKLFGGILSYLFRKWCGYGAKNKKIPDFVFSAPYHLRQDCLDYIYIGDGHNPKNRNMLTLATTSEELANQVIYLWLMQGVVASYGKKSQKGLGKTPSTMYYVTVYGDDINVSNHFSTRKPTKRRKCDINSRLLLKLLGIPQTQHTLNYLEKLKSLSFDKGYSRKYFERLFNTKKVGYKLKFLLDNNYLVKTANNTYLITQKTKQLCYQLQKLKILLESDFIFLPIKNIEVINDGFEYVYDLSVPGYENFVGGSGAIACHNSRGQQGIGISAAALYAQLTTGKPIKILSRISPKHKAHYFELKIDTKRNQPVVLKDDAVEWKKEHGTRIELDIEGIYQKGLQSIDSYIKQTAIVNPHLTLIYTNPLAEQFIFTRVSDKLPKEPKEIKPHPHGVELGRLLGMLHETKARTLAGFLTNEFCRVGAETAKEICKNAALLPDSNPRELSREAAEKLYRGIQKTKLMAPPTDCITPIGAELLEKSLRKEIKAEFYYAVTRSAAVYRGNPFLIEAAVAYGGEQAADNPITLLRFANRVPLLYQQGACAITKAVQQINWRSYGLQQSKGGLPIGPCTVAVHIASVWVPYTSESKEAIAHYSEIIKEIKLALQECGRRLSGYVKKKRRIIAEGKRRSYIEKYIPHVSEALGELLELKKADVWKLNVLLKELLEKHRGKLEEIKVDASEFNEEFALDRGGEDEKDEEE